MIPLGRRRETRPIILFLIVGAMVLMPSGTLAQSQSGSSGAAVGGAALGVVSGSLLGLTGGLGGCNRTLNPSYCSRITSAVGAAVGLAAGAAIGWENGAEMDDRIKHATFGTILGAAGGVVMKVGLQHYGWPDVAAASAVGLAVGASFKGSSIGLFVGATTGFVLWRLHPSVGPGGGAAWSLGGMAAGGLLDWVIGAVNAGDTGAIPMQFSIPL